LQEKADFPFTIYHFSSFARSEFAIQSCGWVRKDGSWKGCGLVFVPTSLAEAASALLSGFFRQWQMRNEKW